MSIIVRYMPEFIEDFNKFSAGDRNIICEAIHKLREKPFSLEDGGYGHVISKRASGELMFVKIIFTDIRIIYKLMTSKNGTLLIFTTVTNESTPSVL